MVNIPKNKASAGRILIKPRGEWDANITYEMLDLVNHNGYAFLAKRTVVGIEPSDEHSSYWHNMLDIKTIVENNIADTVAGEVGDILSERFRDEMSEAIYATNLMADFTEPTFVKWDAESENTPYKVDLTDCTDGFALVYGDAENHTIIAWTKGGENYACYMHNVSNGVVKEWNVLHGDKVLYTTGGTMTGPLGLGDGKGTVSADEEGAYLEAEKDSENKRALKIVNPSKEDVTVENSLKFVSFEGSEKKEYNLFGEHNASAFGLAKIAIGSYVGTGTYGKDNPNSISCGFKPKIIKIYSCANTGYYHGNFDYLTERGTLLVDHNLSTIYSAFSNPSGLGYYDGAVKIEISGSDSGALWYADEVKVDPSGDTTDIASIQCNKSDTTYYFVAIG